MIELIKNTKIDFMGKRKFAVGLSLIFIFIGMIAIVQIARGSANLGIDFAGGTLVQVRFEKAPDVGEIRDALSEEGLGSSVIQSLGEDKVAVRLKSEEGQADTVSDEVFSVLADRFGPDTVFLELVEMVGPQVGADMRRKGILSIIYAMVGILIYVTLRFQFRFALGAISALAHDILEHSNIHVHHGR